MTIQINTDKSINSDKAQHDFFSSQISEELERFETHITRVEVHIKDENGAKAGVNDKTCLLEARLKGRQPIAVTSQADTIEQAVSGAIDKMRTAIDAIVGRLQNH